jgi:hypothetical protein
MSNAILEGRDISSRYIEIRDQAGELLLTVPFLQAISSSE